MHSLQENAQAVEVRSLEIKTSIPSSVIEGMQANWLN